MCKILFQTSWLNGIFFTTFILLYFYTFPTPVFAVERAQVLFINQVRGNECCSKGSLDFLNQQLDAFIANQLPAYFVLRYDALTDENYVNVLQTASRQYPDLIRLGLMIEITPRLAQTATGRYAGNTERWYEAQQALTIGYAKEDAKKTVDTLFQEFSTRFGYYPIVTSSWMIDTETLNYLYDRYGVRIHQITREQWGVDSYTLYGGPPHYPYPPSRSWLFVPDYGDTRDFLIVRQAVTDPLFNYGDPTSAFTTQPNDYMDAERPFLYFISLINQAIHQGPQRGFALLGLENSMEERYQEEFKKQIEHIAGLYKTLTVEMPSAEELGAYWKSDRTTLYWGRDFVKGTSNQAYWITAPRYRVRVLRSGNSLRITDLRLYDHEYSDPYGGSAAQKHSFWIVPYLLDGSHKLTRLTSPLFQEIENVRTHDFENDTAPFIELPSMKENTDITLEKNSDTVSIRYIDRGNRTIIMDFLPDRISFTPPASDQIRYGNENRLDAIFSQTTKDGFNLVWPLEKEEGLSATLACPKNRCEITFKAKPELFARLRDVYYSFLFPEPSQQRNQNQRIRLFVHNPFAVAGRNPVRTVVAAADQFGIPVAIDAAEIKTSTSPRVSNIETGVLKDDPSLAYVDLFQQTPRAASLTISVKNQSPFTRRVYFAPNCRKTPMYCLTHPLQSLWYAAALIGDRLRRE